MSHVLVVDDNKQITKILSQYIKKEGFEPISAFDGDEALRMFDMYRPELVLLDVMMPKKDGFQVCKEIRKHSKVPIIMITAKGEDYDKIMGLDIGADDYIVKPFSPGEVMARIRAILRRCFECDNQSTHSNLIKFLNIEMNATSYITTIDNQEISLTKKEFEILWTLITNRKRVFSREQLLDIVWGFDYFGDFRTVDSHIKRLRAKISKVSNNKWEIKTIWGVGYRFEVLSNE